MDAEREPRPAQWAIGRRARQQVPTVGAHRRRAEPEPSEVAEDAAAFRFWPITLALQMAFGPLTPLDNAAAGRSSRSMRIIQQRQQRPQLLPQDVFDEPEIYFHLRATRLCRLQEPMVIGDAQGSRSGWDYCRSRHTRLAPGTRQQDAELHAQQDDVHLKKRRSPVSGPARWRLDEPRQADGRAGRRLPARRSQDGSTYRRMAASREHSCLLFIFYPLSIRRIGSSLEISVFPIKPHGPFSRKLFHMPCNMGISLSRYS